MTTRRDFLRHSAAAGAALSAGPLLLTADDGKPQAPSERIRIGIIGAGGQGKSNMKAFYKDIVAVCDVDKKRLEEARGIVEKQAGKAPQGFGDFRKLLESRDVDAVVISTPDHWHALPTIEACMAGKHVYCEKPLSLTVAEGRAMVNAARKNKRVVQTGSQQRSEYGGKFALACQLVRDGALGKVPTIHVGVPKVNFSGPPVEDSDPPAELDYEMWLGPAPQRKYNAKRVHYLFRFFWDYSGGQMTNFGAHDLDIMQWALGMDDSGPVSIEGEAKYHKEKWYEVPEWFKIVYKYANGTTVICEQTGKAGVTFEGEKGSIAITRSNVTVKPAELAGDKQPPKLASHHANWLNCIRSGEKPICDVEIGHRSATVCHLGNIALRTGKKLTWDPAREQIVGDAETAKMLSRPYRAPWKLPEV